MNDEEVRRVHVNDAVRDHELEEADALVRAADPGEWRVREGEVQRYSGKPFERREASLRLMARSASLVPRLVRGIRTLEQALRMAWNGLDVARRELYEEREGRRQDALRRAERQTGPSREIPMLARLCALGEFQDNGVDLERRLRVWAGGGTLDHAGELRHQLDAAEKRARERAESRASLEKERQASTDAIRGWIRRLEAGEVAPEMLVQCEVKLPRRKRDAG